MYKIAVEMIESVAMDVEDALRIAASAATEFADALREDASPVSAEEYDAKAEILVGVADTIFDQYRDLYDPNE